VDDRDELRAQVKTTNTTLQALLARITEVITASRTLLARLQGRTTDERQQPPDQKP
jgi:hypothetical protein